MKKFINTVKIERALLVLVKIENIKNLWPIDEICEEFKNLVLSTGIEVEDIIVVKRKYINSSLYIGKGKAEEIACIAQEKKVNVVVFNNNLSFTQQRNLEDILGIKTIDRTQLILDIFARHAHTQEGRLQVELAQLQYLLPRLKGKGIMLSRLGGGIGTRGPGEQKIEIDRRRIGDRIVKLKQELERVRKNREVMRKRREKENIKVCALVGYTNAGKTTLLNKLSGDHQKTDNSMFTTLDTISRNVVLSNHLNVLVTDTVGFIHDLPPNLIEAFKATLEELHYADLLLHIIDASSKNFRLLIDAVDIILKELNLVEKDKILVFNKIDKVEEQTKSSLRVMFPDAVFISAHTGKGINDLLFRIENIVFAGAVNVAVELDFKSMELLDYLYRNTEVTGRNYSSGKVVLYVKAEKDLLGYLRKRNINFRII